MELSWECDILLLFIDVGTVLTVWYFIVFLRCWNCSESVVFCCFSIATVLTVWYFVVFLGCWNWPDSVVFCCFSLDFRTVLTGILLFFMDIGTVLTVRYFVIFLLELSWMWYFVVFHGCWNCSDSVLFCYFSIRTVLTVWYFVVFHGCWNCSDSLVFCWFSIGTVLTVWYFVVFHRCWKWPDSVVFCCFSIGFWNCPGCGILLFFMDVGTVLTVWYFVIFLLELSWLWYFVVFHGCWNCSDSVVFGVFHGCWNCSESVVFCYFSIRTVLTVCYYVIFLLDFGTVLNVVFCCFSWMLELFWQCGILLFFY